MMGMTEGFRTEAVAGIGPEAQPSQSVESQLAALEEKLSRCGDNWRTSQCLTAAIERLRKSAP